jgi:hypothetical protein
LEILRSEAMAEINKLSVGQALDKIRKADASKSKGSREDQKLDAVLQETERMRAMRLRLERQTRAAVTNPD